MVTVSPRTSVVTSSGLVDNQAFSAFWSSPGGGWSLRSRLVRSANTLCRFSWSAFDRVAHVSHSVGGSGSTGPRTAAGGIHLAPRPVRRLVVAHQENGLSGRPSLIRRWQGR